MALLKIRVMPGASRAKLDGWLGEALRVRVTARPEKGKANDAVVALLADTLQISKKDISIASGASARQKAVRIGGLGDAELRARLGARDREQAR